MIKVSLDRSDIVKLGACFAKAAKGDFDAFALMTELARLQSVMYKKWDKAGSHNDDMLDEVALMSTPMTGTECQTLGNIITVAQQMRIDGGCAGV